MIKKKFLWHSLLITLLLASNGLAQASTFTPSQLFQRAAPAVVLIEIYNKDDKIVAAGSGFLVSADGRIFTNYHVISRAARATVRLSNGDAFDSVDVIDVDKRRDIALIKIRATKTPYLQLGDSKDTKVGDTIYSISNPLGVWRNSLSDGLVSAIRLGDGYRFFQVTAAVSHGSSGAPLLNTNGEVVGIIFAGDDDGQNLNFAVPIDYAKGMLSVTQTKSLASIYQPEKPQEPAQPKAEPAKSQSISTRTTPDSVDLSSLSADIRKEGIAYYFQNRIGTLTLQDVEKLIGKPLSSVEGSETSIGYRFPDVTRAFKTLGLFFSRETGKLNLIVGVPDVYLTMKLVRQKFGKDEKSLRVENAGTRAYPYPLLRMTFYADDDGNVLSISYY